MRPLTDHEKRTLRLAGIGLSLYLALFFGVSGWKSLEAGRAAYGLKVLEAQRLKNELQLYTDKAEVVARLTQRFRFDPTSLSRTSLVAQASAAVQRAAAGGGVQIGPLRESAGRAGTRELASVQLEAMGQAQAVLQWLQRLETLGVPLVVDTLQLTVDTRQPGMVKVSLTLSVLDYEQWRNEEVRRV